MTSNTIEKICGVIPKNFVKISPTDNNHIFVNDPNFNAINLYDFFGRAATVNSFEECYYYVELGFETNKINIFDIVFSIFTFLIFSFLIYLLIKKNIYKKISKIFLVLKNFLFSLNLRKEFYISVYFLFFLIKLLVTFEIVKNKSITIPPFIDEYVSLFSNVNFYKSLNFNAGEFIGGNFSVQLTSGIISSIGSVIGWNIYQDIYFSRILNFYWIWFLQILFILILCKVYNSKSHFLLILSSFSILLIPWWQGGLYSIGEIPSTIIFTNSIFLFNKYRKVSLILFSIAVFYGKLLLGLPFVFFYIFHFLQKPNFKFIIKDATLFLSCTIPWLILIKFKHESKSIFSYINDLISFVLGHQSSGLNVVENKFISNFYQNFILSEFSTWNIYEKIRILFLPLLLVSIFYLNKKYIDEYFGNISIPLVASVTSIYFWFIFINTTKWIRHSQHFTIILIISALYFLNFNLIRNKFHVLLIYASLIYYFDNQKVLIPIYIFIVIVLILYDFRHYSFDLLKIAFVLFLFVEFTKPVIDRGYQELKQLNIVECTTDIDNKNCLNSYLGS